MPFQCFEAGDVFEQANAQWLRDTLGMYYEETWARFIGHNGRGSPLGLGPLAAEDQRDYQMFCQCHYSLGVFARLLFETKEQALKQIRAPRDKAHPRSEVYLEETRAITLYLALLGQVCDMIEAIGGAIRNNDLAEKMRDFASERNRAIHAARIPMQEDYAGPKIAIIAKTVAEQGYNEDRVWQSVDVTAFVYLDDWFSKTTTDLFDLVCLTVAPIIRKSAGTRFGGRTVPEQTDSTLEFLRNASSSQLFSGSSSISGRAVF